MVWCELNKWFYVKLQRTSQVLDAQFRHQQVQQILLPLGFLLVLQLFHSTSYKIEQNLCKTLPGVYFLSKSRSLFVRLAADFTGQCLVLDSRRIWGISKSLCFRLSVDCCLDSLDVDRIDGLMHPYCWQNPYMIIWNTVQHHTSYLHPTRSRPRLHATKLCITKTSEECETALTSQYKTLFPALSFFSLLVFLSYNLLVF